MLPRVQPEGLHPEFKRFLDYAIRSSIEGVGCLRLAKRRRLVEAKDFDINYEKLTELIKGLQAVRKSLK
jgi:four helix bundle protein